MSDYFSSLAGFPAHGIGGLIVLLLYAIESEIRFGARARQIRTGAADRLSTFAVSVASGVPVLGFVFAMKMNSATLSPFVPAWFRNANLSGLSAAAWAGVGLGFLGVVLRLWALLTLRERYTRTLLIQDEHPIERGGPYRWVRHPGYLGSLLCLNGLALASGNLVVLMTSLAATLLAYRYRIAVEDEMLVRALGPAYADYRREVRALLPLGRAQ